MKIEKRFNVIGIIILALFIATNAVFPLIASYIPGKNSALILCFSGCVLIMAIALVIIRKHISKVIIKPLKDIDRESSAIISGGDFHKKIDVKTGDELEGIADNFNKMAEVVQARIDMLKASSDKEQHVIRELSMLTEMMGFITSKIKFEEIIQIFLEMTKNLLKAGHSGIFIFEGEEKELRFFKTTVKDEETVSLDRAKIMLQGRLGDAVRTKTALRINEPLAELSLTKLTVSNLMALPLTSSNNNMSALLIMMNKNGGFTEDDEDELFSFAFQAFQALIIHEEIARLAVTDGLTGLSNHRAFQEKLSEEIDRAERYYKVFSLIMMDIDHFKSFNDVYGHQTGDRVLKDIAKVINKGLRTVDFSARYGGEEFIVILPETGCDGSVIVADRIRREVAEHPFTVDGSGRVMLTISAGVACYPEDATEKEDLIRKADSALYFAKERGRNMVRMYQETIGPVVEEIPEALDEILNDPELKDIEKIAKGIDARSHYTKGHSLEVAAYAVMLGKHIHLGQPQVESLRVAGILHDLGNIGIPEYILNKPGYLTPEEKTIIQGHPGLAEMVLKRYPYIEDILPAILYHHERFDGNGYPLGLKGDEIPLLARILSVVEAYQAMVSPRPHRKRMSTADAVAELKKEAGSQFDPVVVNAFAELLQRDK